MVTSWLLVHHGKLMVNPWLTLILWRSSSLPSTGDLYVLHGGRGAGVTAGKGNAWNSHARWISCAQGILLQHCDFMSSWRQLETESLASYGLIFSPSHPLGDTWED